MVCMKIKINICCKYLQLYKYITQCTVIITIPKVQLAKMLTQIIERKKLLSKTYNVWQW